MKRNGGIACPSRREVSKFVDDFLFLMTALSSVLTMGTLKKSDNFKFIILGLIITVLIFYFKDLSIALGQTDRIPLILSVWAPVIALSFFIFIGVLQINEK